MLGDGRDLMGNDQPPAAARTRLLLMRVATMHNNGGPIGAPR